MNTPLYAVFFVAAAGGPFDFLPTIKGPDFLFLYALWFAALFVAVLMLRSAGHDTPLVSGVGLALFEGLGVARYLVGSAQGMHRWEYLGVMMLVGGSCFVLRVESFKGSGGSGGSCGGGSISSCSGGGGCGGGGGGCGGCGGS